MALLQGVRPCLRDPRCESNGWKFHPTSQSRDYLQAQLRSQDQQVDPLGLREGRVIHHEIPQHQNVVGASREMPLVHKGRKAKEHRNRGWVNAPWWQAEDLYSFRHAASRWKAFPVALRRCAGSERLNRNSGPIMARGTLSRTSRSLDLATVKQHWSLENTGHCPQEVQ